MDNVFGFKAACPIAGVYGFKKLSSINYPVINYIKFCVICSKPLTSLLNATLHQTSVGH